MTNTVHNGDEVDPTQKLSHHNGISEEIVMRDKYIYLMKTRIEGSLDHALSLLQDVIRRSPELHMYAPQTTPLIYTEYELSLIFILMAKHGHGYRKNDLKSHLTVVEKYLNKLEEDEKMREFLKFQSKVKKSLLFPIK